MGAARRHLAGSGASFCPEPMPQNQSDWAASGAPVVAVVADIKQPDTHVGFLGPAISDAGSIPAASTKRTAHSGGFYNFYL